MKKLQNKVALITGAGAGVGAATARYFSEQGAKLILTDINAEAVEAVAASLPDAIAAPLDVADENAWQSAVDRGLSEFGGIDILVNNAGIDLTTPLLETSAETFNLMTRVNQLGCFLGMKTVGAVMNKGGSIINLSSLAGLQGIAGRVAYVASKFAVRGMTKVAALELADRGIRVNSVHPGPVNTAMLATGAADAPIDEAAAAAALDKIPLKRVAEPEEIAALLSFLASDDSAYSTGSEFVVDGGIAAGPSF